MDKENCTASDVLADIFGTCTVDSPPKKNAAKRKGSSDFDEGNGCDILGIDSVKILFFHEILYSPAKQSNLRHQRLKNVCRCRRSKTMKQMKGMMNR